MNHSRLRAITLIELLVVLAVIGVLMALALPAVHRAREAGRRQVCSNHLKQLGMALHSYENVHRVFPSGMMSHAPLVAGEGAYSPFSRLLPYLEEAALCNAINFNMNVTLNEYERLENITAVKSRVNVLLCPSDPNGRVGLYGGTCYRVNMGSDFEYVGQPDGAFVVFDWLTPQSFSDGLAYTVAMSEKVRGDQQSGRFHDRGDARYINVFRVQNREELLQLCEASTATQPHMSYGGNSWMLGGNTNTWYNHVGTPNFFMSDCGHGGPGTADPTGVFSASSYHGDGVNTALMDGSIRFVSASIDVNTWRALATRAAGDESY